MTPKIRDIRDGDYEAILSINRETAGLVFPLDPDEFSLLIRFSDYARVIEREGELAGYLFAIASGKNYPGDEYQWFCRNFNDNFLYIDQVAIARESTGQGLGQALYDDVEDYAIESGLFMLACEINREPPNTGSLEFHRRRGFREVSCMTIDDVVVSLQLRKGLSASVNPAET